MERMTATSATTQTGADVHAFVAAVRDDQRRADATALVELMRDVTGEPPVMWGPAIVGFGSRHYRYPSGREGDTVAVGFSPRRAQSAIYLTGGLETYGDLLATLGPHAVGKGCLYLAQVAEVDSSVLRAIIARSYRGATTG